MTDRQSNRSIAGAVGWMVPALLGFCLLAIASRELTATMGTLEILFWRSLIGFVVVTSMLARSGGLAEIIPSRNLLRWHLLRNGSHFGGQCAWLLAIAALPMAEVFALEFTTVMPIDYLRLPLIMLAAWFLYDEAVSLSLLLGAILILTANGLGLTVETIRRRRQRQPI